MASVDIATKPFDAQRDTNLAILTAEHGPFVITVDARQLRALAMAADAALEFANLSGEA